MAGLKSGFTCNTFSFFVWLVLGRKGGTYCSTVSWHFSFSLFFVIDEFHRFTHNIDDEPKTRVNSRQIGSNNVP